MNNDGESADRQFDGRDLPPLTKDQIREIQRRVKDMDSPVRYMIVSRLLPKWKLWFDVSSGTYCDQIDSGTTFKRQEYAEGVLRALKGKKGTKDLTVAKVTTKGGKRKILRYYALV